MKLHPAIFALLWCVAASLTWAAKIVVVPPIMFESHLYIFKTLASALHQEGHDAVFLVSEGREVPPSHHYRFQRYPGIFNSTTADDFLQSKMKNIFSGRLTALELFDILEHYSQNCDLMVGNQNLMSRLREEDFDLVLVDPNEMCGFVIAHLLGVRYAVFSTGLWYPAEVGAPAPLAYVPEFNSLLTDNMNLFQRITNTAVYLVSRFGVKFLVLPRYDQIMKKYDIQPEASMYDLVQGSSLWMLCTDIALEFPRPTLPHVVYVGGILTKPASPLPEEFLTWADTTEEHGFVLVSFGAGVKYLSDDIAHKLAGALGRLPQKVIWRFSGTKPSNLGNNTKLVEWMPQNDLLGHANIKAFLSHGGLNSIYEAMYHGVPVVGIPLFGDHYDTMTRVQAKGMGILLEWKTTTEEELYQSMVKVIHDSRYRQEAQLLSQIHKDQPGHPVSRTVYWINYILRYNGAKHLHSAVSSIPSYQYFLLDVALVMLVGALLILYTLTRIVKMIAASVWSSAVQSKANGHCHNGIPNGKHRRNGHIKHDKKVK
ncbi:2-hydroxyacylsphingosine 1-beta-galactosyltransferase-like isoform X2 [Polyodon spathula]|uniref:2-hydroxyacylsphingosine 1-beta-galactosyltransferase-like isoform X2 n=1 Tax=Polyodon spathula TaxID=7913 RepID=UPI001B7D9D96|nr:2-hydroxyacylsphingosine 1-beta-galactosyltransferase-like isoform X2 [Polyodon spathula]